MTRQVQVTKCIEVTVDETKFNNAFMAEFRRNFYAFDTIDEHIDHIARQVVNGFVADSDTTAEDQFIEGYGPASEMGIRVKEVWTESEIE